MNIHVAPTPPFHTDPTHTCCQGQTSGLTAKPDAARCPHVVCMEPTLMQPQTVGNLSSLPRYHYTYIFMYNTVYIAIFSVRAIIIFKL